MGRGVAIVKKAIGIDLGGTKISGGIVDETGRILTLLRKDTEAEKGREVVLENLSKFIEELMEMSKVDAIGIGSPGTIDVEKGRVLSIGGNISGWAYTNIREELSKKFNLPIFIENDANAAALCEGWIGAGKNLDSFVMITLGTGVGGSIYSTKNGIWHGKNYQGAELGHAILYPEGRKCSCGQRGCSEQYISGSSLERAYYERAGKGLRALDVFINYNYDKYAREVVDSFIKDLGTFLITIKNLLDPEGIIIGGGVINSKEYWWDKVIEYYNKNCNNPTGTKILQAKYLNDAGVIGAAKVAFDGLVSFS